MQRLMEIVLPKQEKILTKDLDVPVQSKSSILEWQQAAESCLTTFLSVEIKWGDVWGVCGENDEEKGINHVFDSIYTSTFNCYIFFKFAPVLCTTVALSSRVWNPDHLT